MPTHKKTPMDSLYQPGTKLSIQSHIPPPPYGGQYKSHDSIRKRVRNLLDEFDQPTVDHLVHLSFVLSNPPLETVSPAVPKSYVLAIIEKVSHAPNRGGAYLVSCHLDSDDSQLYVAKIYDGFGYALTNDIEEDCMYLADKDYSREAAAYENIPQQFQGDIVPRYHGSWSFSLSVDAEAGTSIQQRPVRMILMEHIPGESMLQSILRAIPNKTPGETQFDLDSIDYSLLPPEKERLEVLARILDAEITLWWYAGVEHKDVSPRNIMVTRTADGASLGRVVLVDFNLSHVMRFSEVGCRVLSRRTPGALPTSPITRYWPGWIYSSSGPFNAWIPESWCVDVDSSEDQAGAGVACGEMERVARLSAGRGYQTLQHLQGH